MSHHYPITEIHNHQTTNRDAKQRIVSYSTNTSNQESSKVKKLQYEIEQLRSALCEAIDENDTLRMRVAQLEALLVEAQDQNEKIQQRYICDHNKLVGFWKHNNKDAMQLEKQNQSHDVLFQRSRSL